MKRIKFYSVAFCTVLLILSTSLYGTGWVQGQEDYRNKIVFGHGVTALAAESIDSEFNSVYLETEQPSVTIELKANFSSTEAYLQNLQARDYVSENQVDNFIMQTRQMVDRYYQEAFTEAIREIGCSEDIFEPLDNSFVTLKEEFGERAGRQYG